MKALLLVIGVVALLACIKLVVSGRRQKKGEYTTDFIAFAHKNAQKTKALIEAGYGSPEICSEELLVLYFRKTAKSPFADDPDLSKIDLLSRKHMGCGAI